MSATAEAPPVEHTSTDEFPVDSFREAARELRRPFTVAAVKFKPQAKVPKKAPVRTLCVAYIDARLVVERLNLVVPHLWHDEYEPLGGSHLVCRLTIDGITRQDVGEGVGKALYSDALKRAAVKFGIGVSLYAVPQQWINEPLDFLSDAHQRKLREAYRTWLKLTGRQAFGEPLDHGDVEDAQGDADADTPPSADPATGEVVPPVVAFVDPAKADALYEKIKQAVKENKLTPQQAASDLQAAGASDATSVHHLARSLPAAAFDAVRRGLDDLLVPVPFDETPPVPEPDPPELS